ncbi:MAG TPA: ATP synthase F1 subunit delta [Bacteroidota bacterium]|nr:ATP synthase F1 subunit delta [Bacteroidota bacterium]
MTNERVARRYAEGLFEMAVEQKKLEVIARDLEKLRETIARSHEFLLFLKSPVIDKTRKQSILRMLFEGKLDASTVRFLHVLAEKGRENVLQDIIARFFALQDEREGIVTVEVKTATDFSTDQTSALRQKLESLTKKKVKITFGMDKQLKGGFVARVGDTVFDGSIKRQLELLRERFAGGSGPN